MKTRGNLYVHGIFMHWMLLTFFFSLCSIILFSESMCQPKKKKRQFWLSFHENEKSNSSTFTETQVKIELISCQEVHGSSLTEKFARRPTDRKLLSRKDIEVMPVKTSHWSILSGDHVWIKQLITIRENSLASLWYEQECLSPIKHKSAADHRSGFSYMPDFSSGH